MCDRIGLLGNIFGVKLTGELSFLFSKALRPVVFTYIEPDGTEKQVDALVGTNLMQVAHDNNIELEGKIYIRYHRCCHTRTLA